MKNLYLIVALTVLVFGCAQQGVQPKDWYNFSQIKTQMKDDNFRKPIDDLVAQNKLPEAAVLRNIQISKVTSGLNDHRPNI